MDRTLKHFDYSLCYEHYVARIDKIRQQIIKNERIMAKPILLLTIIDCIEGDRVDDNRFVINDWFEEKYKTLFSKYVKYSQFENLTGIEKPFWHLETDGFWHLKYQGEHLNKANTPSRAWLKEKVDYAFLEEDLWILLQNKEWRIKLRDFIVKHKLIT